MNILTKNRIIEKGDEVWSGNGEWRPVPDTEWGLQVQFSKYGNMQIRRPSEPVSERPAAVNEQPAEVRECAVAPAPTPQCTNSHCKLEHPPKPLSETYEAAKPRKLPTVVSKKAHASKEKGNMTLMPPIRGEIVIHGISAKDAIKAREQALVTAATEHAAKPSVIVPSNSVDVTFPPSTDPTRANDPVFTGRNGTFYARGLRLKSKPERGIVEIRPIASRGLAKNALIEFPAEIIPQVIDFLLRHQPTK